MAFKEKLSSIFGGADASSASTSVESAPGTPSLDALQSELKGGRKRQSKAERLAGEVKAEQELNDLLDRLYQRENWEDIAADRKSTRLNSSHQIISYAVFCLKKKKDRSAQHVVV